MYLAALIKQIAVSSTLVETTADFTLLQAKVMLLKVALVARLAAVCFWFCFGQPVGFRSLK